MKILIVEDDIQLNTTITNFLVLKNYEVKSVFDGKKALKLINDDFDMFIIDINIPEINGIELLKEIRKKKSNIPVIMITASLELENFQESFKYGCSEYIKKPFYLEELEIRIEKLKNDNQILEIDTNLVYDMKYEELKYNDEIIDLTNKEKKLLTIFLENINHIVANETIEKFVWDKAKEEYPIRQLVNHLRKKLPKNYIVSKKGIGYKFEVNL